MVCKKCEDWTAREIGPCPEHALKLEDLRWVSVVAYIAMVVATLLLMVK